MAEENCTTKGAYIRRKGDKDSLHAAVHGHDKGHAESVSESAASVNEELEKTAQDWVNRLPETLQDEP